MNENSLILLSEYSSRSGVDSSFILLLEERGLIRTVTVEQQVYIDIIELPRLEKITRFHEELEINIEGIEAITGLLERIDKLQSEITSLENRLRIYE